MAILPAAVSIKNIYPAAVPIGHRPVNVFHTPQLCIKLLSKLGQPLGFLRMNLAFAPSSRSTKEVAYKTLVRPRAQSTRTGETGASSASGHVRHAAILSM